MAHTFVAVVGDRFLEIPKAIVAALGAGRSPRVRADVDGRAFVASVTPHAGRFFLPLDAEPGAQVTVTLEVA